jgi:GxxExxY protein
MHTIETLRLVHGAASRVMKSLGNGHSEAIYHRALLTELSAQAVPHRYEVCCPFMYNGECVGHGRADVVVGGVIIEIKTRRGSFAENRAQLLRYIKSLAALEGRPFHGMVLVMDRLLGTAQARAIDAAGRTLFNTEEPKTKKKQDEDQAAVTRAFARRYRFTRDGAAARRDISVQRLLRHLRDYLPRDASSETAIKNFIRQHFVCRLNRGRVRVAVPRDGSGVGTV